MECVENWLVVLIVVIWIVELHFGDLDMNFVHLLVDHTPSDLVVSRRLSHDLLSCLVVCDDTAHHANGLAKGALEIVINEPVLLQEILSNNLGHFKCALLILREGVLSDKLHNLCQVILLLQDLLHLLLQETILWVKFVEEWLK